MGYFNRTNNKFSGGNNFNKRGFDDRNSDSREMFQATCSNCSKNCEVPFKPTGSKPVLCNNCFRKNRNSEDNRFESRSFDRPERRSFDRPENRNFDRPRYDKPRFEHNGNYQNKPETIDYKEQFISLNTKIDKLTKMVANLSSKDETFIALPVDLKPAKVKPTKKEIKLEKSKEVIIDPVEIVSPVEE
ncbi:MAG: CxxC-x17-CxxC domain-containing protein [Candidatus Roizmanbacteria bacterium]